MFVNILLINKLTIMKKYFVSLFCISLSFICVAQLDFSASGLVSAPLFNFDKNQYSNGWGGKFGLGYTHMGPNEMGIEYGFNWLINQNGSQMTSLPLGDYTLSNNWYNWQFKLNGIFEASEYPNAAGTPESGTGMTMSAFVGYSFDNCLPISFLHSYTFLPPIMLSGLAK